jgi:hypothetical protein
MVERRRKGGTQKNKEFKKRIRLIFFKSSWPTLIETSGIRVTEGCV